MSGHGRNICVMILQDQVEFLFIIDDEIVNAFFVERIDHLEELRSEIGCDCKCSSHFLTEVLPYVVKVILQDGSYWLNKHSNHWISHRIKEGLNNIDDVSKVNAYIKWCLRIDVKKKELLKSNNSLLIERMPGYIRNSTSMIMNERYSMNR